MSISIFLFLIAHLQKKKKIQQTLIFRISAQHFCPSPSHTQKDLEHCRNQCGSWPRCICLAPGLGIPLSCPTHLRCVSQVLPWPRLPALFTHGPGILATTAPRDLTCSASRSFQLQVPLPTASTPGIPATPKKSDCYNAMSRHFLEKGREDCVSSWEDDLLLIDFHCPPFSGNKGRMAG